MASLKTDPLVKEVAEHYASLTAQLADILWKAIFKGKTSAKDRRKHKAAAAQAVISTQKKAIPLFAELLQMAYFGGAGDAEKGISKALGSSVRSAPTAGDRRAINGLLEGESARLTKAGLQGIEKLDKILSHPAVVELSAKDVRQMDRGDLIERVEKAMESAGITWEGKLDDGSEYRMVTIKGRNYELGNYAELVAHTTSRAAHTAGLVNRALEYGYDIVSVTTHKHGDADDVCAPYDGKSFSLTGRTKGYPVLDKFPPFHVRCVHVLTLGE